MRIRSIISLAIVVLLTVPALAAQETLHPTLEVMKHYQPLDKDQYTVDPFVVNLMALDLLKEKSVAYLDVVKQYLHWYLENLNYADKYDITGSMYRYTVSRDGKQVSLETSGSICRYAASFLLLLEKYIRLSGDRDIAIKNKQRIEDAAYNIPFLQGTDGLIRSFPDQEMVYLTDNCIAYSGLNAILKLSKRFRWHKLETYYREIRVRLYSGIFTQLYDTKTKGFIRVIDNGQKIPADLEAFNPDAISQIYPIVFDVLVGKKRYRKRLWRPFRKRYPGKWENISMEQQLVLQWASVYSKRRQSTDAPPIDLAREEVWKQNRLDFQYIYEYLMPHDTYGAWESYYIKYYRYQNPTFNFFIHGGMVKREGKNDYIGLLGFAKDWHRRLYTYTVVAKGTVSTYLPNARLDHDINFKMGKYNNILWTIGATYIKYYVPAEDFIISSGLTWYLPKWVLSYRLFWNHKYPGNITSFTHLGGVEYGVDKSNWTALSASWGSQAYMALYVLTPEQIRQNAFNINLTHRQWLTRGVGVFGQAGYLKLKDSYEKILLSIGLFLEF